MTYKCQGFLTFSNSVFHNIKVQKDLPSLTNVYLLSCQGNQESRERGWKQQVGFMGIFRYLFGCVSNFAITIQLWRPRKSKVYSIYCASEKMSIIHRMLSNLVFKDQSYINCLLKSKNLKILNQPTESVFQLPVCCCT